MSAHNIALTAEAPRQSANDMHNRSSAPGSDLPPQRPGEALPGCADHMANEFALFEPVARDEDGPPLNSRQLEVIRLLREGYTVVSIMERSKLSRSTYYNWTKRHPRFVKTARDARQQYREVLISDIDGLQHIAIENLERWLRSPDTPESLRFRATTLLLRYAHSPNLIPRTLDALMSGAGDDPHCPPSPSQPLPFPATGAASDGIAESAPGSECGNAHAQAPFDLGCHSEVAEAVIEAQPARPADELPTSIPSAAAPASEPAVITVAASSSTAATSGADRWEEEKPAESEHRAKNGKSALNALTPLPALAFPAGVQAISQPAECQLVDVSATAKLTSPIPEPALSAESEVSDIAQPHPATAPGDRVRPQSGGSVTANANCPVLADSRKQKGLSK